MDPVLLKTATAFGLAGAAGLNTTLPLLLVGLLARFGLIELAAPFDALSRDFTLIGLAVLALVEVVGDKVSGLDSLVHAIQGPLAAAAGAVLFASQTSVVTWVSPEVAILVGVLTAGGVHVARAAARPAVTTFTFGVGNPIVSAIEDVYAVVLALVALFAPVIAVVFLVALLAVLSFGAIFAVRRGAALRRSVLRHT
jgi:hypothetical protein